MPTQNEIQLAEAIDALHKLTIGVSVAEATDENGMRVRYTPANREKLQQHIQTLQAAVARESGVPNPAANMRRPLTFVH